MWNGMESIGMNPAALDPGRREACDGIAVIPMKNLPHASLWPGLIPAI